MNPDNVPPIAEVINTPSRIYVFTVSETCQTCSRNIGKLLEAVRTASLNKKYASRKKLTLDNVKSNFVSVNTFFRFDLIDNLFLIRVGSLKKMSIGSERMKKIITEGKRVSARGAAWKKLKLPLEKGRAISSPAICPR